MAVETNEQKGKMDQGGQRRRLERRWGAGLLPGLVCAESRGACLPA